MFIAYMLELHRTLLAVCLDTHNHYCLRTNTCLLFSVIALFANLSYLCYFTMKIMSGRINMTQAQLAALIQEQVVVALAAAQAGGISCSNNSH
ncbi:hypothetical protein Hanom_Chr12g01132221 [Helianthus anomalus]